MLVELVSTVIRQPPRSFDFQVCNSRLPPGDRGLRVPLFNSHQHRLRSQASDSIMVSCSRADLSPIPYPPRFITTNQRQNWPPICRQSLSLLCQSSPSTSSVLNYSPPGIPSLSSSTAAKAARLPLIHVLPFFAPASNSAQKLFHAYTKTSSNLTLAPERLWLQTPDFTTVPMR